jgi:enoyl-CoA hydratase/carnithine racemase
MEEIEEGILKIMINRPEKGNALSRDVLKEFVKIFKSIMDKKYVVIITGYGDKYFSAGADIKSLYDEEINVLEFHKYFKVIEDYPYPVIAMINGYCFGAACELVATCDIRVAGENAILSMPPTKLGLVYSYEGIAKFIKLIGWGKTKLLFLTGKRLMAKEAHAIGLIDYLVPKSILEEFTLKLAHEISESAPLSIMSLKRIINLLGEYRLGKEDIQAIESFYKIVLDSEDMKEGLRSFLEKRKPKYRGA